MAGPSIGNPPLERNGWCRRGLFAAAPQLSKGACVWYHLCFLLGQVALFAQDFDTWYFFRLFLCYHTYC